MAIRPEIFSRAARAVRDVPSTQPDERIERSLVRAARMRGVSADTLERIAAPGAMAAVWSKTYTESHASRLTAADGRVLFETETPLTHEEMELIRELGIEGGPERL